MKKQILYLALTTTALAAQAASYYVVAPVRGKAPAENISVALSAYALPDAQVGVAYPSFDLKSLLTVTGDQTFQASRVSWTILSSTLPAGLAVGSDGVLRGTPTLAGTGSVAVRATYRGSSGEQTYQVVTLHLEVALAGSTPPRGLVGQAYSFDAKPLLSVTGAPGYTGTGVIWSIESGALPAGLTLDANTGVISGVPSAAEALAVTLRAAYRGVSGEQAYQFVTTEIQISLGAATLANASVGTSYSHDFKPLVAVIGDPAYSSGAESWAIQSGSLPAGMTLNSAGVVGGTPTAGGAASFELTATYKGKSSSRNYSLYSDVPVKASGGVRTWADGTLASSCQGYLAPAAPYKYVGAVGNGVYRVNLAGGQADVYCDMTTNGGGWTRFAYFNQATTSYSTALTNTAPSGNWNMAVASVPNFASGQKMVVASTKGTWIAYSQPNGLAVAGSAAGWNGWTLAYNSTHATQGQRLWIASGFPTASIGFNPCGTGQPLALVMAYGAGAGTWAGIQVWQSACDSGTYAKQDVPFEIYTR